MWMSSMDLRCTLLALLSARYIYAGMSVKQIDLGPKINIIWVFLIIWQYYLTEIFGKLACVAAHERKQNFLTDPEVWNTKLFTTKYI